MLLDVSPVQILVLHLSEYLAVKQEGAQILHCIRYGFQSQSMEEAYRNPAGARVLRAVVTDSCRTAGVKSLPPVRQRGYAVFQGPRGRLRIKYPVKRTIEDNSQRFGTRMDMLNLQWICRSKSFTGWSASEI